MTHVAVIAVVLMLTGAALLVLDVGGTAIWLSIIALGIALVAIDANARRQHHP